MRADVAKRGRPRDPADLVLKTVRLRRADLEAAERVGRAERRPAQEVLRAWISRGRAARGEEV